MKTLEEIKIELLSQSHSLIYSINDEEFEASDAEFQEAINNKAQMLLQQQQFMALEESQWKAKVSAYQKLGLTIEEIEALAPTPEWLLPQE